MGKPFQWKRKNAATKLMFAMGVLTVALMSDLGDINLNE